MQEKTDITSREIGPQKMGKQHQVVVMNPKSILFRRLPNYCLEELLIDAPIGLPFRLFKGTIRSEIVKKRPESPVGKAEVVSVDLPSAQEDWNTIMLLSEDRFDECVLFAVFWNVSWPSEENDLFFFLECP